MDDGLAADDDKVRAEADGVELSDASHSARP
jgi:hypothetical protein